MARALEEVSEDIHIQYIYIYVHNGELLSPNVSLKKSTVCGYHACSNYMYYMYVHVYELVLQCHVLTENRKDLNNYMYHSLVHMLNIY